MDQQPNIDPRIDRISGQDREPLVAFGSIALDLGAAWLGLGAIVGGGKEKEKIILQQVRPPVYGLGLGAGAGVYHSTVRWRGVYSCLLTPYQSVQCFISISSRRVMLESFETMLTAAERYFQPF